MKVQNQKKIGIEVESSESDTHSTEKKRQRTGSLIETEQEIHKQDQETQNTEQQAYKPSLTDSRQSDSSSKENGALKKCSGYPTPRQPSRSRNSKEDRTETSIVGISAPGPSHELQDKLVEFITRDQPINRSTPSFKYLETELDRLHDACLDAAYEEITTVLNQTSSPSPEFQPAPRHWPMNPLPGSVLQSQDCGYIEQANRQYNQEQFQTL
ncbi:Hypothetical predicted protein [Mytilus galloprovincialis]|uniref:Uncharacterized protein n=1 Tax=Mytilus galloprovincialis TaxID=29158 RepID=A0A8B6DBS0_MYTGA|nr:Hypothetical predicted protein [Mytilus galloprovincialis]